jgi:hypothetical protein
VGYSPPPYGPYSYYETVSAFRKSIKLDDKENAIFWLEVMIDFGDKAGKKTAAKQLWIMAAEDCMDQQVTMRAFAVWQMIDVVGETDQLYFLTYQMCNAVKWWESEEGREVTTLWAKAEGDVRRDKTAMAVGGKLSHEVPSYARDRHTSAGWATMKSGGYWDDRFSGTWMGRLKSAYMYVTKGRRLTAEDYPDQGFLTAWDERVQLQGLTLEDDDVKFGVGQIRGTDGHEAVFGPNWAKEHFGTQPELFGE